MRALSSQPDVCKQALPRVHNRSQSCLCQNPTFDTGARVNAAFRRLGRKEEASAPVGLCTSNKTGNVRICIRYRSATPVIVS